ncbi:three-prime repair exonuclease 1 [Aplysia californica]|uniref:Three-prime repair exonuclease 1 n=1 Tax=Aplysia californica TaxID=6500 RepID=A0ABM0JQ19_APLCA|nr:three-prime repair exonuclease 1 [Aplysia californica]
MADSAATAPTIQTFVMLDIEATGLPEENPKITELSFVAVTREAILKPRADGQTLPRVLNKLNIAFQPHKNIVPRASRVSGIENWMLSQMHPFGEHIGLLRLFLEKLPQPVCLIAFNGDRFDFPLLMKELHSADQAFPDSVLHADSLHAFMTLIGRRPRGFYKLINLYQHTFGRAPHNTHTADGDCVALLEIICTMSESFVKWCDKNAFPFRNAKSMV